MIVNVCPAAVARATPERVWDVITDVDRLEEWQDAKVVSAHPPGRIVAGQHILLRASGLGRTWPVTIDIPDVDPQRKWVDFVVKLPFGVVNHEHMTFTPTPEGNTLIRFN